MKTFTFRGQIDRAAVFSVQRMGNRDGSGELWVPFPWPEQVNSVTGQFCAGSLSEGVCHLTLSELSTYLHGF